MANSVFYYALVAVDAAGNRGQVSNLVPVFVPVQEEEEQDEFEFRSEPDHFSTQVTNSTLLNRLSNVKNHFILSIIFRKQKFIPDFLKFGTYVYGTI